MSPRRHRSGVAAVEFILTLPIVLLVMIGIVELSLLQSRVYLVSRAARDASRVGSAVIEGPDPTGDVIEATAETHAQFVLDTAGVACGSGCIIEGDWHGESGWMMLTTKVSVPYTPFTGLMPMISDYTVSEFTMLTQQQ